MSRPIRVGLIGTGFGRVVQGPGFMKHPKFELVALASARKERAESAAAELGVKYATDDWRRMLSEVELDLVSVITPPVHHHPMGMAVLESGRDLLLEKPTAMDAREARELLDTARAKGRVHALNHEFRWVPERAALRARVASGAMGRLQRFEARAFFDFYNPHMKRAWGWLNDATMGGGILGAIGSHIVDYARFVAGEIRTVSAQVETQVKQRADGAGQMKPVTADDGFSMLLEFESGATGSVVCSSTSSVRSQLFEAHGENESLILDGDLLFRGAPGGPREPYPVPEEFQIQKLGADARLDPFYAFLESLAPAIEGRTEFRPNLEDGLKVQQVLDAARLSSSSGRRERAGGPI